MKKRMRWPWFVVVPSILVLLGQWMLDLAGLHTICVFPYYALRTLAATALTVGIGFLVSSFIHGHRAGSVVKIVGVVAAVLVALVGFQISSVWQVYTPTPIKVYTSPDKSHQIVALQDGWIDYFYLAYPLKSGFYYTDKSLPSISEMGQAPEDIQVRWLDDYSAKVYFIYDTEVGPLDQDSLLVTFH